MPSFRTLTSAKDGKPILVNLDRVRCALPEKTVTRIYFDDPVLYLDVTETLDRIEALASHP